jgi:hypothetical protein
VRELADFAFVDGLTILVTLSIVRQGQAQSAGNKGDFGAALAKLEFPPPIRGKL